MGLRKFRNYTWRALPAVILLAIGAGGFFSVSQSGLLAIDKIEIEGNRAISTEEIMEKAGPLLRGQSLLKPSFADVDRALLENPFTESVEIERDFPHTIRIRLREHRPFVNLMAAGNKVYILSSEGKTLVSVDQPAPDMTLLSSKEPCEVEPGLDAGCQDVTTGVWFLANIPMNFNQEFAEVSVADGDIRAKTRSGVNIHFGSLDDYALKFEVLRQLLARSVAAGAVVTIDVSVPERPVTKDNTATVQTTSTGAAGEEQIEEQAGAGDVAVDDTADGQIEEIIDPATGGPAEAEPVTVAPEVTDQAVE